MPNEYLDEVDRYVGTEANATELKTDAWSFEAHRRLGTPSDCVFPFAYNSQPRITCVFNDSNLDDDDNNDDVQGTLLS